LITGGVSRMPCCDNLSKEEMFEDKINWEVPQDYGTLEKISKALRKKSKH